MISLLPYLFISIPLILLLGIMVTDSNDDSGGIKIIVCFWFWSIITGALMLLGIIT